MSASTDSPQIIYRDTYAQQASPSGTLSRGVSFAGNSTVLAGDLSERTSNPGEELEMRKQDRIKKRANRPDTALTDTEIMRQRSWIGAMHNKNNRVSSAVSTSLDFSQPPQSATTNGTTTKKKHGRFRTFMMKNIVASEWFVLLSMINTTCAVIFSYTAKSIANRRLTHDDYSYLAASWIFVCLYLIGLVLVVIELAVSIAALRLRYFFSKHWKWQFLNTFDLFVCIFDVATTIAAIAIWAGNGYVVPKADPLNFKALPSLFGATLPLRYWNYLLYLPASRKLFRAFQKTWRIIGIMIATLVIWQYSASVFAYFLFSFDVIQKNSTTDACPTCGYFRDLENSMFRMFQLLTNDGWGDTVTSMASQNFWGKFIGYIAIVYLIIFGYVLLNAFTAIVTDGIVNSENEDYGKLRRAARHATTVRAVLNYLSALLQLKSNYVLKLAGMKSLIKKPSGSNNQVDDDDSDVSSEPDGEQQPTARSTHDTNVLIVEGPSPDGRPSTAQKSKASTINIDSISAKMDDIDEAEASDDEENDTEQAVPLALPNQDRVGAVQRRFNDRTSQRLYKQVEELHDKVDMLQMQIGKLMQLLSEKQAIQ